LRAGREGAALSHVPNVFGLGFVERVEAAADGFAVDAVLGGEVGDPLTAAEAAADLLDVGVGERAARTLRYLLIPIVNPRIR
jgi:hypothetical protein